MNRFQNMAAQSNDARILAVLVLSAALASIASPAFAAADGDAGIDWFTMGMQLFGGLAIFLFGMEQMAESLRKVAGNRMKDILGKLTTNRFMGVLTGAFVTSVIQSSSITTVMLVGFVTAGLMSLSQAVGVIFGANIGTTVTAQIVAFKVTHYALLLVAAGFVLLFGGKSDRLKTYGVLIMGLGLIFFGMGIMSSAMKPLRSFEPFLELMRDVSTPAVGILIAAVFTGLVQSSSATTGVVIAMASQGLISLEGGIALIMGANIGTCVTAGLASIGKPREAVRVAVAHVTFNVAGVAVMVWFIPYLAEFVRSISPAAQNLSGIDRLAAETPRQIANAHTIFNVLFSLIFLPLAGLVARFCEWVVPDKPVVEPIVIQPKYLDKELLSTPPLAIDRARREIGRLGGLVEGMLEAALSAVVAGDEDELQGLANMDTDVDILHGHIIKYLGKISARELSDEDSASVMQLIQVTNHLEQIGDIVETNIVRIGHQRIEEGVVVSDATKAVIERFHAEVLAAFGAAMTAVREEDREAALAVKNMKKSMAELAEKTARYELSRLVAEEPNRLQTFTREMEIIECMSRIYRLCRKIARTEWTEGPSDEMLEAAE